MALLTALLLAGGATLVLYRLLRRNAPHLAWRQVVVAAHDLPAGVALTAQDVKLAQWPASLPLQDSLDKLPAALGRPLIYPLQSGQPLLAHTLAEPGSGLGLSPRIPPGMRATSVRSNNIVGVAGFLYPGCHVDVLVTFNNLPPQQTGPVTQTILQNAEVLTAGEQVEPDPRGKPHAVNVVTLLLKPPQAQKLLMASTQGSIQFVLRNGADTQHLRPIPTRLSQLVAFPVTARRGRRPRVHPGLLLIEGSKRVVVHF